MARRLITGVTVPLSVAVRRLVLAAGLLGVLVSLGAVFFTENGPEAAEPGSRRDGTLTVIRRDFVRSVRLSGTVEAVRATTISVPRLAGQNVSSLVITRLIRAGSQVQPGDPVVEFDRQEQLKNALDRRVELNDLEQQIRKKEAEERAAKARDDSEIAHAESSLGRAELDMVKNEMLPKIQAEKNTQALEEAKARLAQLKTTFALKRKAAAADLRILQIRRDKATNAMRQAESNAERMSVRAPIGGMAVIRTIWKSSNMSEVQEGEEVRAGVPVLDIVDPSLMRVRAKVNQADVNDLAVGQLVRVGLDAYPDLRFDGRVAQISPIAVRSALSASVRTFVALIDVEGSHPNLMPDLTASLDVEVLREPGVLVVPRDALRYDGGRTFVRIRNGSSVSDQAVTPGAMNAHEAVITAGLAEGAVIVRHANFRGTR